MSLTVLAIETECENGADDDADGLVDCADPDCAKSTGCLQSFIRGDCNADGAIDIADPIHDLAHQFTGGPARCLDAHDVNDDGAVDLGDPIAALAHLFTGGPPPPAPFPSCGVDPTPDTVTCAHGPSCP